MAIVFTCSPCETRSLKVFTKHAYHNGVVLVRCPGCEALHLIADRLGDESMDVEKLMALKGEQVKMITGDNVFEMTAADVVGASAVDALLQAEHSNNRQ
jgi:protein import protein ZIM17